jgi:hypothetical protein
LDPAQRYAVRRELRREAVPQIVPADPAQTQAPANHLEAFVELPQRERRTVLVAEDQLAAHVSVRLQGGVERLRERHLGLSAAVGVADDSARAGAPQRDQVAAEVDVAPFDRELLARSRAGVESEHQKQSFLRIAGCRQQLRALRVVEEVPRRFGDFDLGQRGKGIEIAPLVASAAVFMEARASRDTRGSFLLLAHSPSLLCVCDCE